MVSSGGQRSMNMALLTCDSKSWWAQKAKTTQNVELGGKRRTQHTVSCVDKYIVVIDSLQILQRLGRNHINQG